MIKWLVLLAVYVLPLGIALFVEHRFPETKNWVNAWTAKHPWLYALSFSAIVFAYSVGYGVFFRREHLVTALPTAVISGIIIFVLSTWRTKRWGPRQEQSTSAPRR